jgi:hypothetical protein
MILDQAIEGVENAEAVLQRAQMRHLQVAMIAFNLVCYASVARIVLLLVMWLVSLPFILFIALFRRERYGLVVTDMLLSVHCSRNECGTMVVPQESMKLDWHARESCGPR